MKTKYTYKQIWTIAYPILISLIMEQLIGMTDTAFLGRVGEIELGASAIAGVYYLAIFMMAFGFSIGAQILLSRCLFLIGSGSYTIYTVCCIFTTYPEEYHFIPTYL